MPNSDITIIWTPIFYEWYVVRHGSKNGHPNDTWSNEIARHSQYMLTILGYIIGETYTITSNVHESPHFDNE